MPSEFIGWMRVHLSQFHQKNFEKCLPFLEKVAASEHGYDFTPLLQRFVLCILPIQTRPGELSQEATQYFADIDALHDSSPLLALKLVMLNIAFAVSGPHEIVKHISTRLHAWLLDDTITRAARIDWGTEFLINLPRLGSEYDSKRPIEPLFRLYIDEATASPEFIATKFDQIATVQGNGPQSQRTYLFNQFVENPADFVQLARLIHKDKPELLSHGLRRCLWEGGRYQRSLKNGENYDSPFKPTEPVLRTIANELFSMLDQRNPSEGLCQTLLLEAHPDEAWYQSLLLWLWDIEKQKTRSDTNSIKNCFIVILNSSLDSTLAEEAEIRVQTGPAVIRCSISLTMSQLLIVLNIQSN